MQRRNFFKTAAAFAGALFTGRSLSSANEVYDAHESETTACVTLSNGMFVRGPGKDFSIMRIELCDVTEDDIKYGMENLEEFDRRAYKLIQEAEAN